MTAPDALTTLISRLREMEAKATVGPWCVVDVPIYPEEGILGPNGEHVAEMGHDGEGRHGFEKADAALIVEMRNGLPLLLEAASAKAGEADYQAWVASQPVDPEDVTPEALAVCAHMLEEYGPECFPANELGQIHFARSMMAATAKCIRGFLSATDNRAPVEDGWREALDDAATALEKADAARGIPSAGAAACKARAYLASAPTPPTGSRETPTW